MATALSALYVHLPWCERKCPYCDFNSYEAGGPIGESAYVEALLADLGNELALRDTPVRITSVFFGGGTPSLFSAPALARVLERVRQLAGLDDTVEVTVEANPGSAEAARFRGYRAAGINRLSLGVQSFDDTSLERLGRVHCADESVAAIALAREAGFDNLNLDLMYGLPPNNRTTASADLEAALRHRPEHLSWYQLTLEPGTAFARRPPALPDEDRVAAEFDAGSALLADAGFDRYEVSAWARAGRRSAHNLNYWRFGEYIGIGAGAHGMQRRDGRIVRREKIRHPLRYQAAARDAGAVASERVVDDATVVFEYMLNALRLRHGFSRDEFERATGLAVDFPPFAMPLARALERGWLETDGDHWRPSVLGYRFLNDLQMLFLPADGQ